jgi:hypothetical protein
MALSEKITEGLRKHAEKTKTGKKKETKREVSHFRVEPVEGGHMVETHFKSKGSMGHYEEPHKSIHKTMASAAKHMCGQCSCGSCGEADSGVAVGGSGKSKSGGKDEDDTEEY